MVAEPARSGLLTINDKSRSRRHWSIFYFTTGTYIFNIAGYINTIIGTSLAWNSSLTSTFSYDIAFELIRRTSTGVHRWAVGLHLQRTSTTSTSSSWCFALSFWRLIALISDIFPKARCYCCRNNCGGSSNSNSSIYIKASSLCRRGDSKNYTEKHPGCQKDSKGLRTHHLHPLAPFQPSTTTTSPSPTTVPSMSLTTSHNFIHHTQLLTPQHSIAEDQAQAQHRSSRRRTTLTFTFTYIKSYFLLYHLGWDIASHSSSRALSQQTLWHRGLWPQKMDIRRLSSNEFSTSCKIKWKSDNENIKIIEMSQIKQIGSKTNIIQRQLHKQKASAHRRLASILIIGIQHYITKWRLASTLSQRSRIHIKQYMKKKYMAKNFKQS